MRHAIARFLRVRKAKASHWGSEMTLGCTKEISISCQAFITLSIVLSLLSFPF